MLKTTQELSSVEFIINTIILVKKISSLGYKLLLLPVEDRPLTDVYKYIGFIWDFMDYSVIQFEYPNGFNNATWVYIIISFYINANEKIVGFENHILQHVFGYWVILNYIRQSTST